MSLSILPFDILLNITNYTDDKLSFSLLQTSKNSYLNLKKYTKRYHIKKSIHEDDIKKYNLQKYSISRLVIIEDISIIHNYLNNLFEIRFDDNFNSDIKDLQYCKNVRILTFGKNFNYPVDNLPLSLHTLQFGYLFNQPVDNVPLSLHT